ncbi:MAG: hypothetical protein JW768_15245 [Chitinispirillaceae bacterium]|nr:hypothetical protein [Chitinispirillaceae bacterium]
MATRRIRVLGSEEYSPGALRFIGVLNIILIGVALIAVISLIIQKGFYLKPGLEQLFYRIDFFIIQYYLVQFIIKMACARSKSLYLKRHWFESLLALLILSELLMMIRLLGFSIVRLVFLDIGVTEITEIYIGLAQFIILMTLIAGAIRYNPQFVRYKFHPSQLLMLSFFIVILCGSLLLMLPRATHPDQPISYINALFTAASATCVTGLTVVDTATYFTRFGQLIILCLIQIGGLGIMTLSSFLVIFFGKGIGVRERVVLQEMLSVEKFGLIVTTLRTIVVVTFGIEAVGALLLMLSWSGEGWPLGKLVYTSVFHAISGFCNAGFSTFSDSICSFSDNTGVLMSLSLVIVLGGIGFMVMKDLGDMLLAFFKRQKRPYHLKIQTRVVLIISLFLILFGAVAFYLLDGVFNDEIDLKNALFMSIATRTSGFSSVDFFHFGVPTLLVFMFLMIIGGSPGSTGGGIKTTTLAVLLRSVVTVISGQNRIILFRRTIPFLVLNRALVVFTFAISALALVTFLLTLTENAPFINIFFEATSAFATVGLSCGLSPDLSFAGKCIVVVTMFVGRIGTITLAFAITAQSEQGTNRIEYPTESIMIG